jgi:HprK-related kinase B
MTDVLDQAGVQAIQQPAHLTIGLDGFYCRITSNSDTLIETLRSYFQSLVSLDDHSPHITVEAIECAPRLTDLDWQDWPREPGKTGRKEAYIDLPHGRLVRKVKTGLILYQSKDRKLAIGPCLANPNQVINFVNVCVMNAFEHRSFLICHAAACHHQGRAMAFAALSGGGKSTLMLQCLLDPDIDFLSNDRLLIKDQGNDVIARGVPKLPRVNPGTLLHNPALRTMLSADQQAHLEAMPRDALWDLEDKYDVDIEATYGPHRIQLAGTLSGVMILNWDRESHEPTRIQTVDLETHIDLLEALMKSSGPLYISPEGQSRAPTAEINPDRYFQTLRATPMFEVTGGVDFEHASEFVKTRLKNTL